MFIDIFFPHPMPGPDVVINLLHQHVCPDLVSVETATKQASKMAASVYQYFWLLLPFNYHQEQKELAAAWSIACISEHTGRIDTASLRGHCYKLALERQVLPNENKPNSWEGWPRDRSPTGSCMERFYQARTIEKT